MSVFKGVSKACVLHWAGGPIKSRCLCWWLYDMRFFFCFQSSTERISPNAKKGFMLMSGSLQIQRGLAWYWKCTWFHQLAGALLGWPITKGCSRLFHLEVLKTGGQSHATASLLGPELHSAALHNGGWAQRTSACAPSVPLWPVALRELIRQPFSVTGLKAGLLRRQFSSRERVTSSQDTR